VDFSSRKSFAGTLGTKVGEKKGGCRGRGLKVSAETWVKLLTVIGAILKIEIESKGRSRGS